MTPDNYVEREIASRIVDALLSHPDWQISIRDGIYSDGQWVLKSSRDKTAILGAMFSTDDDLISVFAPGKGNAWIALIYGNGWDVIHDYTISMEATLAPVQTWIDEQIQA